MILSTHGIVGSQIQSFVGLLDTYPNAAAAYSVRKLRIAYTGSAIRVRRSSDNTETDIGFSGANLDTSALTSFCGSSNGFVTTWYDQSGNSRNATQTTAANQPQIVSSGSVLNNINGLPTIQFDGINDNLTSSSFTSQSQPYTIFMVHKWIGSTYRYLLDLALDSALGCVNGGVLQAAYFGGTINSSLTANNTRNQLYYALANSTTSQISINNETPVIGNAGTGAANKVTIGSYGGNLFFGNTFMSELVVYFSNNSSNRTGISTNINTYYAIY
jgi:hypothetical protein